MLSDSPVVNQVINNQPQPSSAKITTTTTVVVSPTIVEENLYVSSLSIDEKVGISLHH